jgi:hypothetical protein
MLMALPLGEVSYMGVVPQPGIDVQLSRLKALTAKRSKRYPPPSA